MMAFYKPLTWRLFPTMFHKILTAVLAAVVLVEGAYILLRRHPANRSCFRVITTTLMKVTAVWLVAFDTGTAQLCRNVSAARIERIKCKANR